MNAQIKKALAALKSGNVKQATALLEALLASNPAPADEQPDAGPPEAARSRIAQALSFAQGAMMGEGPQVRGRFSP